DPRGADRSPVRVARRPARPVQRDRAGQERRHGRDRRRPGQPERVGRDRTPPCRRSGQAGGHGVRRVLPVPGRHRPGGTGRRHRDHPTRRLDSRRDGDRGCRPAPRRDGLHRPSPLPALMTLSAPTPVEKLLALEMVRVTEAAAIESARYMGRGDRMGADRAATEAMRRTMDEIEVDATIVIGEGERDEAPMLYIGERVGRGGGTADPTDGAPPLIDIAVDPLEGTNLVATGSANAITVLAASEQGGLLHAPDTYLEKLAVGPGAAGHVDITRSPTENCHLIAEALGRRVRDLTIVILERPRHEGLIEEVRQAGARI